MLQLSVFLGEDTQLTASASTGVKIHWWYTTQIRKVD